MKTRCYSCDCSSSRVVSFLITKKLLIVMTSAFFPPRYVILKETVSACINRMKRDIWNNCWMLLFSDNQIGKNYIFHYIRYVWNTFIQIVEIFFSVTKNTSLHSRERYAPKNWSKLFISPSVMGRHLSNSVSPNWTETLCMDCTPELRLPEWHHWKPQQTLCKSLQRLYPEGLPSHT